MSSEWRLVDSGSVGPLESMAVDEAILECHSQGLVPATLHFYVRARPVVSLGYFQKVAETVDLEESRRRGVHVLRRRSGGSSIYTDSGQLMYGLVVRAAELPPTPEKSFEAVCSVLARAISRFGVAACYRAVNDVEIGGRKVSGSAQFRRRESLLQHGTILVDADLDSMDAVLTPGRSKGGSQVRPSERVTTLARASGVRPEMADLKCAVADEMSQTFGVSFERSGLTQHELNLIDRYVEERYSRDEWNAKY